MCVCQSNLRSGHFAGFVSGIFPSLLPHSLHEQHKQNKLIRRHTHTHTTFPSLPNSLRATHSTHEQNTFLKRLNENPDQLPFDQPLISTSQSDRVEGMVSEALRAGAKGTFQSLPNTFFTNMCKQNKLVRPHSTQRSGHSTTPSLPRLHLHMFVHVFW